MIPSQTFEEYTQFGADSTKSVPDSETLSDGFAVADVLPAEWMNWAWYHNTKGINDLNTGVESIEAEINNVVEAGGVTPSQTDSTQLLTSINYLIAQAKSEAILAAHPIGSLYWSASDTDPSTLFGGTWSQIKDTFILAAGDTYTNGATGGSATVQLTEENLPAHTHTISHTHNYSGTAVSNDLGYAIVARASAGSISSLVDNQIEVYVGSNSATSKIYGTNHSHTYSGTTKSISKSTSGSTGSGTAHDNMPPYTVKYCWQRTA